MDTTPSSRPTLESLLERGRINEAIDALSRSASGGEGRRIREHLESLRESYALMSRYTLEGADDPQRTRLYNDILAGIRDMAASLSRMRKAADNPSLYFSTLRYLLQQTAESISSLTRNYETVHGRLSQASVLHNANVASMATELDSLEKQLFNRVWTTHPLSSDDTAAIDRLFSSPAIPSAGKQLMVAALMAGELEWHDDRRIVSLVKAYRSADATVSVKALCALLATLWLHRKRPMRRAVADAIAAAADSPHWSADLRTAFLQFIRSRDTERVNRKLHDEILPNLMKMRPEIEKRFKAAQADMESLEDNPEWDDLLDRSGIKDRLKEISELQEEGSDVMMGTFVNLKSFPFFNDIHHWFVAFNPEHPAISPSGNVSDADWSDFIEVITGAAFLCDNDKFSLACAFAMMPADKRRMIVTQFKMQNVNLSELRASSLTTSETNREAIANKWVQSLYRFYKLFRRKDEFSDIFAEPLNPLEIPLLREYFACDTDTLRLAAEFYFKRGYWQEARHLFEFITGIGDNSSDTTGIMHQKAGVCAQRIGDLDSAIAHFTAANDLRPSNPWTLRRLGAVLRLSGQPQKALPHLTEAETLLPDDAGATLAAGNCLLELGRYGEAINHYYKVDFLEHGSRRALRPLAWALMMAGRRDKAREVYAKLLDASPEAIDLLNAGHLELLDGNIRNAMTHYRRSLELHDGDREAFVKAFEADMAPLACAGADTLTMKIIIDNV